MNNPFPNDPRMRTTEEILKLLDQPDMMRFLLFIAEKERSMPELGVKFELSSQQGCREASRKLGLTEEYMGDDRTRPRAYIKATQRGLDVALLIGEILEATSQPCD